MALPKQVTHSTIFLLVAAALMYFLWIGMKPDLGEKKDYVQIIDFDKGQFSFEGIKNNVLVNEPQFLNLDAKQNIKLKNFFVGKFIKKQIVQGKTSLNLPLDFYDALCFSPDKDKIPNLHCPLPLHPQSKE